MDMHDLTHPNLKVALVHEWFVNYAGAERVVEQMLNAFPEAELFALVDFLNGAERHYLGGRSVKTTFIQNLPFAKKHFRNYFSLFPLAVEQHDLRGYDVVISSSHLVSKGAITAPNQPHICYCHSPVRYGWDLYHQYLEEANLTKGLKASIVKYLLHRLRTWDALTANRPDFFIANSEYIAQRMRKVWRVEAKVIYPPVDTERFQIAAKPDEYYFTAGRFVPYKKIDLIVKAFQQLPHLKLVVCGDGPQALQIKAVAGKNVEIIAHASETDFANYMSNAKAFLYAAEEDFGIIIAEAQAAGVPVIAFGKGGATEIIDQNHTGILYQEQNPNSLVKAIQEYEKNGVSDIPQTISNKAQRFSKSRFIAEYQQYVNESYLLYTKKNL